MEYANLDLWIDPQEADYYPVRVNYLSNEVAAGKLTVASVEALRQEMKSGQSVSDALRKKLGASLFQALLAGAAKETYRTACEQTEKDQNSGLRIRLRIAPPEVAALPWELLYDEVRKCFLSTSTRTMLVRFVEPSTPPKKICVTPPLRVLVIIPKSLESSTERRLKMANDCLKDLGKNFEVKILDGKATRANIDHELVLNPIHIIHFVGDGVFAEDEACLLLDDQKSEDACSVTAKEFSYYFADYPSLKLIVLQAGTSATPSSSLRCVAEELVQLGLSAAICTSGGISDEGTRIFAQALYPGLCEGYDRGRVDVAISHARKRVIAELKKSLAFANVILFMCSTDGEIFEFEDPPPIKPSAKLILSIALRVVAMALILCFIVFIASHTKLLNLFRVDDYANGAMRRLADRPEGMLNSNVKLIIAEQDNNGELGSVLRNVKFRQYHADLLNGLTKVEQKPKVIVLDLKFDLPESTNLDTIATAIGSAQGAKIRVVGGQEIDNNGQIVPGSIFPPILGKAFGDSWGDVEVGGLAELPLLDKVVYINEYEIASLSPGTPIPAPVVEVRPSLALKAVMEYFEASGTQVKSVFDEDRSEVLIKDSSGAEIKHIPVIRKGISLEMPMKYVPHDNVVKNAKPYIDVHKLTSADNKWQLETLFSNSILVIGYNTEIDTRKIIGDESRNGAQIHANAISNVLNDEYIRHVSGGLDFGVIVIMVGLGILIQTVLKRWLPGTVKLSIPKVKDVLGEVPVPISLLLVGVAYLLITYVAYSRSGVSFAVAYHLAALVFGYGLIAIFRNRLRLPD